MKYSFTLAALIISALSFGQVTRNVLVEHFTSNSSLPSASQNPLFYGTIIDPNVGDVIHIAYHKQGGDIFGDADPSGVNGRQTRYGSTNIPFATMSGRIPDNSNTSGGNWLTYPGAPTGFTQAAIDNELLNSSDVSLKVTQSFNGDFSSLNIRCVITNETSGAVNMANRTLYLSLVTETLNYSTAPNSNGETYFRNTHRGFVPDETGTALSGSLAAGDSIVLTFQETTSTDWVDLSEIKSVAFIQNNSTDEIIQAGESSTPSIASSIDLTLEDATTYSNNYCSSTITPVITVINSSSGTVDSVEISVIVNGVSHSTTWFDLPIVGAGQENVQLSSIALDTGSNEILYEITDSRGDIETDYSNNKLLVSQLLYIPEGFDNSAYTFESDAIEELPERGYYRTYAVSNNENILYVADQSISSSVNQAIGGFGDSENALVFDFFSSAEDDIIEFYLEENGAVTPDGSATLKLDYAYAERQNSGDRLLIMSSTDCGTSWDTIFDEQGSSLATANSTNGRFWPTATDWDSLEFNFSTAPLIRFVGMSERRNALYLDNIIMDVVGNSNSQENHANVVKVYPNPFNHLININSSAKNISMQELKYNIYDLSGRTVLNGNIVSNQTTLNVDHLHSGSYIIHITDQDNRFHKVINIIKP
jgi:hypothetical protein